MEPVSSRLRRRARLLLVAVIFGLVPSTVVLAQPKAAHASGCGSPTGAYSTAVLADCPSAYYRLGESSGTTATDDSGNSVTGTYAGSGVTYGATGAISGDGDTAITTSVAGPALTASDGSMPSGSDARTYEIWEKSTSLPAGGAILMIYGTYGILDGDTFLYLSDSTTFYFANNGNNAEFTSPYSLTDGNWHELDITYDGNVTADGFVDGQQVGTVTLSEATDTVVGGIGLQIGGWSTSGSSNAFTGSLDEAAIYPTALSSSDINSRWQIGVDASSCRTKPTAGYAGTVAHDSPSDYYILKETSGDAALDYSGNCQDAAYAPTVTHTTGALMSSSDGSVGSPSSAGVALQGSDTGLPSGSTARTVEIWEQTSSLPASAGMLVAYGNYGGSGNQEWALDITDSTTIAVTTDGDNVSFTTPYSLTDGNWHMIDVTFDGSLTVKAFVDGRQAGSTATLSSSPATASGNLGLEIGGWTPGGSSYAWNGDLDDVAVFPTALSATHIEAHYLASGDTPPPVSPPTATQRRGGGLSATETCSGAGLGITQVGAADPVDTETGAFSETFNDVSIAGRSCPLQITRTYNSDAASTDGPFGYGWTWNYGMNLAVTGTSPNEVATITQENGSQLTFNQPASGDIWTAAAPQFLATLTYNSGSSTWTFMRQARDTYTFNSSGQLTQAEDLNGYTTSFSYTSGNLTTVTDPAGRTLTIGWTGSHITSVTDANVTPNRTVSYSYDGSGNLEDVTDVNGGDTHFTYSSHLMTVMKDPVCEALGGSCPGVQNHYNGSNQVDWQKDQLNRETTFSYSGSPDTASGGTAVVTDPSSNEVEDGYQFGLLTFETRGYGTGAAATTYYTYDPSTLALTGTMDPNGNVTSYTVDSSGNVLTTTDPLGRVTTNTYNSYNELLTSEDGNSITTTNTYDGGGNLTSTSRPLTGTGQNQETDYTYGNGTYPGDVTQVTDPNGKVTYYHYDANGYQDEVKDPLGNVTGTVRNADGFETASYTPKAGCTWNSSPPTGCSATYETAYTVDASGNPLTITDPLSHVTTYGYDADERQTTVEDGNGNTTTNAYDLAGELCWTLPGGTSGNTCASPPTNARITDYNADGTVSDYKDGKGNTTLSFGYDFLGRVTSTEDANSHTTTYVLDADGNVLNKIDPSGTCTGTPSGCTTYTYDADNEVKTVSYSDNSSEDVTSTTYDSDGQRTAMTDGTGASSWTFDSLHRLTAYTNGNGATVTYGYTYGGGPSYDLKDQVRSIAYPNSVGTVTQSWNDDGTLASVTDWNSKQTTFSYDANANETGQTVPSTTNVTDTFGYNAADQMSSVSDSNGSSLFSATYTLDSDGLLASDSSQASNQSAYKRNALNQVCYAGSSTTNACASPPGSSYPYAFDNADNLTTNNGTTQQYNSADQLCWAYVGSSGNACGSVPSGATTFGYDNKDNETSMVPSAGSATCDTYDQANLLTAIKTGTGSACTSPTTVGTYGYDGDGLRESKTVSGTTTQFTWDGGGGNILQQYDGTTKTSYIYGPGGLPVEQIAGSTTTYLHHDQIGSTRLITDSAGATGTATTVTYDPYGNVLSTSGSLTSPFGFTGVYTDNESGLYYLKARYYDPSTAQFLTVDPAVDKTRAPFSYAAGDPLFYTDPSGLDINPAQPNCDNPQDCRFGYELLTLNTERLDLIQQVNADQGAFNQANDSFEQMLGGQNPCAFAALGDNLRNLFTTNSALQSDTTLLNEVVQTENMVGNFAVQNGYGSTRDHNPLIPIKGAIKGATACSAGIKGPAPAIAKGSLLWACGIGGAIWATSS